MKLALILLLAPLLPAQIFSPPGAVRRYAGTPTAGDCTASAIGRRAVDYSAIPSAHYKCSQASSGVYEWEAEGSGGGSGGDVGGGSGLTTAGAGLYVLSNSTVAQDAFFSRTAAGQWQIYNSTATTGSTRFTIRGGAGDALGTDIFVVRNSSDQKIFGFNQASTQKSYDGPSGKAKTLLTSFSGAAGLGVSSDAAVRFWSTDDVSSGSADLGLARSPSIANTLLITNGSSTNYWGIGSSGIQCLSGDGNSAACDVGTTGARIRNLSAAGSVTAATGTFGTALTLYNATGPNTLTVRAGSSQTTTNLLSILNSAGTSIGAIRSDGSGDFASLYLAGFQQLTPAGSSLVTNSTFYVSGSGVRLVSGGQFFWTNNAGAPHVGTADLGLARSSANNLAITNGSSTNYFGIGAGGIQCLSGDGNSAACDVGTTGARVRNVNAAGTGTFGGVVSAAAGTSSGNVVTIDGSQTLTNKSIAATQLTGTVATARLGSGTADSTTYLRGDQTWATVSGGATASSSLTDFVLTRNSGTLATLAAGKYAYGNGPLLTHAGSTFSPVTLTVTGTTGNGVTPIVVTVSSLTGTSLQQGHTVHITGVGGNTAANGTHVVEVLDATHISLTGKTGNGTYTSGGVVAGTGSGTCPVYGTPQGYAQIDCPASTGLIMSCTGSCTMRQSPTSTIADDGTYFGDLVVVGGAWSSATDQRGWLNRGGAIQAGQGISTSVSGGTTTVNVDGTVARTTGNNSYTGANNFTLATRTAPHRASTGSPASRDNCTVGDTYFQTDATAGQNQWGCTATNTWTLQGGGGSSAPTPTSTTYLVDEFFQGGSSTAWGQLGWRGVATAGSGTAAAVAGTANHPGTLRLTTTSGNGDGLLIDLRGGSVNPIAALNGSGGVGFGMTTIFKTSSAVANERIEIGWFDAQADGANNMIGINFIPAVSHTKFQCTVMVSGTRTYVDSGVTPANSTWYAAKLNINSSGVLTCDINGTTSTTSATFPTSAMAPAIWIQNSTAAAQTLDVDWVAMAIPNGGR